MRRRRERGAVLVETAIVVPILILLAIGIAELGLIVRDRQTAVSATRSAARVVSSSGDTRLADYDAIASLAASLADVDPNDIQRIVIFAPDADGSMPAGCELSAVTGICNHYQGSDLSLVATDFAGTTDCSFGAPDASWCPISRETRQSVGPDWIGVNVQLSHHSIAPFLSDRSIADTTVMRLEPRFDL
ncbi:MAG: hypothetical protein GY939_03735 [Actinomycetia bacterium]|nr:hypothetical protein [Actinomycetes bacterium]